ncbi:MAG: PEP-CTERM sorting domain-containing protein [Verrucomicrobia bacterium]|nr:PEP-CTERM sorting domain-containing protein [Verrucomicrobiota bacterium]
MKPTRKIIQLLGMGMALAAPSAMGAFSFTDGDLILGFQAKSGTGATKNVFFNLGAGTYHRDNPGTWGSTPIGNISTTLSATYGTDWYSRTDLWFGVVGNLNQQPTSGIGSRLPVNGDPSRTFYTSTPTATIGGGVLYAANAYPSDALGIGGNALSGMEGFLPTLTTQADGAAILDAGTQPVQWTNGWSAWNPTPGAAFTVFTGGIQQNFGKGTAETYVDLQRILSTNTGASPTGVVGGGTYETTFSINSLGQVASVPEPSAAMLALIAGAGVALRRRRSA